MPNRLVVFLCEVTVFLSRVDRLQDDGFESQLPSNLNIRTSLRAPAMDVSLIQGLITDSDHV